MCVSLIVTCTCRWEFKAQHYDSVLLFKMGKFYEMFEMDAHVGAEVLGLMYMKATIAHLTSFLHAITFKGRSRSPDMALQLEQQPRGCKRSGHRKWEITMNRHHGVHDRAQAQCRCDEMQAGSWKGISLKTPSTF